MSVAITHPGARLLVPALETLADVVAGDWASAARLCSARLRDPVACGSDLDAAAARGGVRRRPREPYRFELLPRMLLVEECPAVLAAALDLQVKLWMGQWDALEQVALPSSAPRRGWRPHELLEIRARHQRVDTWPGRPYARQSLFLAPTRARLAHHVLTQLDGGGPRSRYEPPAGPAAVHVG
jgi:hypothetical protein